MSETLIFSSLALEHDVHHVLTNILNFPEDKSLLSNELCHVHTLFLKNIFIHEYINSLSKSHS